MAAVGPLTTTCVGALWLAITTPGTSAASTCAIVADTAIMPPGTAAAAAISSPRSRAAARNDASSNTPAAHSAVSSPKLCPATASAFTPNARISASSDRLVQPIPGWAHSVRVRRAASAARSASSNRGIGWTTWSSRTPSQLRSAPRSQGPRAASKAIASSAPMVTY